jgi:hypothetical protein
MTHAAEPQVTHSEFVAAYMSGRLPVQIDPRAAARLVSGQMMLPLVLLPLFGIAVGLALVGYLIPGAVLFVAALAFRFFVRRSAPGFVLKRSLEDPRFYDHVVAAGILQVEKQVVTRGAGV